MGRTSQPPIPVGNTTRNTPSSLFLSLPTSCNSRVTGTGGVRSNPSRASNPRIRSRSAGANTPSRTAASAASAVPTATASPWFMASEHFSMACPSVCPRLSLRRSPASYSSRSTISALTRTAADTTADSSAVSPRNASKPRRSSRANSSASAMTAALTASASPARNSLSGSVRSSAGSQTTNRGWVNVPAMFLYPSTFTPFLPPTEASTCPSSVVETNPNGSPRM